MHIYQSVSGGGGGGICVCVCVYVSVRTCPKVSKLSNDLTTILLYNFAVIRINFIANKSLQIYSKF